MAVAEGNPPIWKTLPSRASDTASAADIARSGSTLTQAGRAKRTEAQREWKRAQLALNDRLGSAKVVQLHHLLDECLALMTESAGDSTDE